MDHPGVGSLKPVVALVGRPNVGKSTLFNRIVGRRAAIVQDMPGVTRDRHYGDATVLGEDFIVIDTGGFEPAAPDQDMLGAMRRQAEIAIAEADVVVCLFDGREGLLPADEEIVRMLQRSGKVVHHAVNKIDGPRHDVLVAEFWALGVDMLWPISAEHGGGVLDLLEAVLEDLPDLSALEDDIDATVTRVAIVGKPNVGKSTLVNRLLGEERLLTNDAPGTTRDAIDSWITLPPDEAMARHIRDELEALGGEAELAADGAALAAPLEDDSGEALADWEDARQPVYAWEPTPEELAVAEALEDEEELPPEVAEAAEVAQARERLQAELAQAQRERRYLLIDTAGVRRRKWVKTTLEKTSIVRSFKSIDRAEVCLLVIDATLGVTDQDAKLAGLIQAKGKACVILVNKWDAMAEKDTNTAGAFVKELKRDLHFIDYAPILFISALSGQRVHRIMSLVDRARRNWHRRVRTGELNRFMEAMTRLHSPPSQKGKRLNIYYASQVSVGPPTFMLSVNYKDAMHFSYQRFLLNRVRERWHFEGTPVRIFMRGKVRKKGKR